MFGHQLFSECKTVGACREYVIDSWRKTGTRNTENSLAQSSGVEYMARHKNLEL